MASKTSTPRRIADRKKTENLSNATEFKAVCEFLENQAKAFFPDGKVPILLRERETALLLSVSLSSLRKDRTSGQLASGKGTKLPLATKLPKLGVRYKFSDIIQWFIDLPNQQNVGGGK